MGKPNFEQTEWSLVLRTRDERSTIANDAVARLCEIYWFPVYSFIRRKGNPHHAAQDLTQGFFLKFIEKGLFQVADRDRGRFRSFMMKSIENFLREGARADHAQKRGGGKLMLSLDYDRADRLYGELAGDSQSPEVLFDKYWAQTVLSRVEKLLELDYQKRNKSTLYEAIHPALYDTGRHVNYDELGKSLDMTAGATRNAVYRMRKRFGELVRDEVARTVGAPEDVEDEIQYLMQALS